MNWQPSTTTRTVSTAKNQPLSHYSQRRSSSWAKQTIGIALTSLSLGLLAHDKAKAVSFTFEKVVDTNTTLIPDGTGTFESFNSPSLDNGDVAFTGWGGSDQAGIYTNIGGKLRVVADSNTPIPGSTDTFDYSVATSTPSIDSETVAFESTFVGGIYIDTGGKLRVVADRNTPALGVRGSVTNFAPPSLNQGSVAFQVYSYDGQGIQTKDAIYVVNPDGKLRVVVDSHTSIPGSTDTFENVLSPSLSNGDVAFDGSGSDQAGIYTNIGGKLNIVADDKTSFGGTATLSSTGAPSLDNGDVAFIATFAGPIGSLPRDGIYTNVDGKLNIVADRNTPIPSGTGNFDGFQNLSLDDGNVAFTGDTSDFEQSGIYTNIGGELAEVIAMGNRLDGKEVKFTAFGPEGLSGNQIAFKAGFEDDSQGIYIATAVPEASSVLGTLAFGTFGAGWMLKRKLKKQTASRAKPI